jgi:hypothetical protein
MVASTSASENRPTFWALTVRVKRNATPLTDHGSVTVNAGRPRRPAGRSTRSDLGEAPLTMSTRSPVASWMSAAMRASRASARRPGRSAPSTRTRMTLMNALPGRPWKWAGSANQAAPSRVVSTSGGLLT